MKSLGEWTKNAAPPAHEAERDERIEELSAHLFQRLQAARDKFSLRAFSEHARCTDQDLELAKRHLFHTLLDKAWQDGRVVTAERNTLAWVVEHLEIPSSEAQSIQLAMAKCRFGEVLSDAMDDGVVDDAEADRLDEIAQSVGLTLSEFVNSYFLSEGEDFLRGIFAACTEGGFLLENVWDGLVATSQRLGLAQESLIEAILPQADRFFEHVLADAKADGELTEQEEAHVLQLVRTLDLPTERRTYIENTIAALRIIPIPPHLIKPRHPRERAANTHPARSETAHLATLRRPLRRMRRDRVPGI